jgi:hypothetical protein
MGSLLKAGATALCAYFQEDAYDVSGSHVFHSAGPFGNGLVRCIATNKGGERTS